MVSSPQIPFFATSEIPSKFITDIWQSVAKKKKSEIHFPDFQLQVILFLLTSPVLSIGKPWGYLGHQLEGTNPGNHLPIRPVALLPR